jgi:hypothetical protein
MTSLNGATVIDIAPKSATRNYRKHHFTVTFIPALGDTPSKWKWSVTKVRTVEFDGHEDTFEKAIKMAQRRIDKIIDGE